MKNSNTWNPDFYPCYTPEEALKMGVFEGKYLNGVKDIPKSWLNTPKVLGPEDKPDETLNHYGVKSRQPLSVWREKGWVTKDSPLGWFQWYCLYYLGRRLEEDKWQIGRWRSFVARHMGQIKANCDLKDEKCRPVQRQALLQWGWDSSKTFDDAQRKKNLTKLGLSSKISQESLTNTQSSVPLYDRW